MLRPLLYGLAALYFVAIHLLLALMFLKTDAMEIVEKNVGVEHPRFAINHFHNEMVDYHRRLDATVPPGSIIFIGASHVQSLNVGGIANKAVNYGIGGDTIADIMQRLPVYRSLTYAGAIVLSAGFNDLRYHARPEIVADYKRLLAALPDGVPLIMSAIMPIDEKAPEFRHWPGRTNKNIVRLNQSMTDLCAARPKCQFADAHPMLVDRNGRLAAEFHVPDGVHLSAAGYRIWSGVLAAALQKVQLPNTAKVQ